MITKFRHWRPAEDLLLQAAIADGLDLPAIAAVVSRTVHGTRWRMAALGLKVPVESKPHRWTKEMDDVLRAEFGKPGFDTRGIGRRIGKTASAVKQRAMKLGLRSWKWWTKDELKLLRARYGSEDAIGIARDLGRTRGQVHRQAAKLRLHRWPRLPKSQIERVKRLFDRDHLPDMEIARRLGLSYWRVKHIRKRYIGKPAVPDVESRRRGVEKQFRTLGVKSGGELRSYGFRKYARENGWPEDCRPREVQILNVLAGRGVPMTNIEIATAIGMRTDRIQTNGQPAILIGNGPGGTYTASLIRRGLVLALIQAGPQKKTTGKGCSRRKSLYTLGPAALAILQERAKCEQTRTA